MCFYGPYSSLGCIMLILLFIDEQYVYFCGFSVETQSGATIRDVEIPVLEDITDEGAEGMSASESKKATQKQSKLKVPWK